MTKRSKLKIHLRKCNLIWQEKARKLREAKLLQAENKADEASIIAVNPVPLINPEGSFVPSKDESSIDNFVLEVEKDKVKDTANESKITLPSGRRFIEIDYLFEQLELILNHSKFDCKWPQMKFINERQVGLSSRFVFKCTFCGLLQELNTTRDSNKIDNDAVLSCIITGSGYSQFREHCSTLNMPLMSFRKFSSAESRMAVELRSSAWECMKEAGREEAALARAAGEVDEWGRPLVAVVADGAWSKRSYKTQYNANSAIIGQRTKKILFLGVRNKYCAVCARAEKTSAPPRDHVCYRNWSKSSTAMEADIIVEGFNRSLEMHGVVYSKLLGDGDSSVTRRLHLEKPYGEGRQVEKVECVNHLFRNYCNKLQQLSSKRFSSRNQAVPANLRKNLACKVQKFRSAVKNAIRFRRAEGGEFDEQVRKLEEDVCSIPSHVFGEHADCLERRCFCQVEPGRCQVVEEMKRCGLFGDVVQCGRSLVKNARSLYVNETNNPAECFNSVLCKFLGGKRVNFTLKGGYETRCFAAALSYNGKGVVCSQLKDPIGVFTKKYADRVFAMRNNSRIGKVRRRKMRKRARGPDKHYGEVDDDIVA